MNSAHFCLSRSVCFLFAWPILIVPHARTGAAKIGLGPFQPKGEKCEAKLPVHVSLPLG